MSYFMVCGQISTRLAQIQNEMSCVCSESGEPVALPCGKHKLHAETDIWQPLYDCSQRLQEEGCAGFCQWRLCGHQPEKDNKAYERHKRGKIGQSVSVCQRRRWKKRSPAQEHGKAPHFPSVLQHAVDSSSTAGHSENWNPDYPLRQIMRKGGESKDKAITFFFLLTVCGVVDSRQY